MTDLPQHASALERFRQPLYLTAQLDLDPLLKGKLDLSGVIQQTLLEANNGMIAFQGRSERELWAWLRRILVHNLIDEVRKLERAGYDAKLEISIHQSSLRLQSQMVAEHTPPDERASKNEELLLLANALLALSEEQRTAVIRHHLQKATLNEVASEMNKSREAVAGLIHRGMTKLRTLLVQNETR